ncbi:MAG TPA: sodium:proton antiporter [Candidatus Nitrosotalea sp.]|nr:sodium:proton antiporter [Candidatus Nitrosotalea sp.]
MNDPLTEQIVNSQYLIPIFLGSLFATSFVASKIRIPYAMILACIGITISILHFMGVNVVVFDKFKIDPRLILIFIVPPLIFDAMIRINRIDFKSIQISTFSLATVGTVLATVVGGLVLGYISGLPFIIAFAFAALMSPTDATVVIEIFKRVRVPKSLSTLMQSEASLNDATGAIIYSSIIAIVIAQGSLAYGNSTGLNSLNLDILGQAKNFAIVFFGGMAVGLAFAVAGQKLHKIMDDPLSETGLTLAIVFGAVVTANILGFSGLVAVAIAGLYFGHVTSKQEKVLSEKTRTFVFNFWDMIAYVANSLAFLYLGLSMNVVSIGNHLPLVGFAVVAVLAGRFVSTYSVLGIANRFTKEKIPMAWRNVAMIGSMRGAISVALVGTLPESDFKNTLQTMTFGVVLCSLILQYPVLLRYIKIRFKDSYQENVS